MSQLNNAALGRCFFPPDRLSHAEVAIVLGMNDPERPAHHAIKLYRAGVVDRLLFTGGPNSRLGASEADCMVALARAAGIPADAILTERRARNTDENAALAFSLMEEQALLDQVQSIMLVTIHYHLRRACLAARRWFPPRINLSWACYPSRHYTADNWFATEQGQRDVQSEIDKIQRYYGLTPGELQEQSA